MSAKRHRGRRSGRYTAPGRPFGDRGCCVCHGPLGDPEPGSVGLLGVEGSSDVYVGHVVCLRALAGQLDGQGMDTAMRFEPLADFFDRLDQSVTLYGKRGE